MRINADFIWNAPSVFGNCKFYPIIATIPTIPQSINNCATNSEPENSCKNSKYNF